MLLARIKDHPVGFFIGFELKPTVYFAWFYGVLPPIAAVRESPRS